MSPRLPQVRPEDIPPVGFGTFNSFQDNDSVAKAVKEAVRIGYRHFDLAALYGNEKEVGAALRWCIEHQLVTRKELFLVTKLWNNSHRKELVLPALRQSLADLGFDYVDCYMVHWPVAWTPSSRLLSTELGGQFEYEIEDVPLHETWAAMEEAYDAGLCRSLGVSNFGIAQLQSLASYARVQPVVNEVELHPYLAQVPLVDYCTAHGIRVTAYSPLGKVGYRNPEDPSLLEEPVLQSLAQKLGRSVAQVVLRWALQRGLCVIPKSLTPSRVASNFDLQSFALEPAHMDAVSGLDRGFRFVRPPWWSFPEDAVPVEAAQAAVPGEVVLDAVPAKAVQDAVLGGSGAVACAVPQAS